MNTVALTRLPTQVPLRKGGERGLFPPLFRRFHENAVGDGITSCVVSPASLLETLTTPTAPWETQPTKLAQSRVDGRFLPLYGPQRGG